MGSRFEQNIKMSIQALGWKNRFSFMHLEDDIASVAYWYQREPHQHFMLLNDPEATDDPDLYV